MNTNNIWVRFIIRLFGKKINGFYIDTEDNIMNNCIAYKFLGKYYVLDYKVIR